MTERPFRATFPRRALGALLWSPLLLLSGLIHILCRPMVKRVLIAVLILDIPLHWGKHFDYKPEMGTMGALGGFDVSITTIALFGLYVGWFFSQRLKGHWPQTIWNIPIVAYTTALAASALIARDTQLAFVQIFLMVQMLLLYIYLAGNLKTRSDLIFVLRLLLIGGIAESAYMLVIAGVGHDFSFMHKIGLTSVNFVPVHSEAFVRQGGTIGAPNYSAAYLAIIVTLALILRRMAVPSSLRRLATPAMLLAALALIATLSRGGWIELLLSFAIVLLATWRRSGISLRSIALVFGGCLVVFLFLYIPNPVSTRVFADDNGSAQSRIPLMRLSYRMISANPLMGVGANNFVAVMNGYAGSEFRHAWIYTVHNEFLLVCSETGIIGLAVFSWIFLDLVRRAWRLWQSQDPQFAPLGLGIVAAIGGYMLHMTVDIFSERGLFQLIWTLAACIAVCEMILRQDSPTVFPFRKAQKVR